ncbi:MAG: cyclase family protein [Gammaproteobacteria bacterium]|nr:cyclase family protein [Gammaproteobacteria bacterium]MCW5584140.1 cyclase family protein [Gammaproteobacteria bacterium]
MNLNKIKLIDLIYTLSKEIPHWSTHCGFHHQISSDYNDSTTEIKFQTHKIEMHAGIGTHMDSPAHCFSEGKSIADINLEQLFSPCIVIDAPNDYQLLPEDIILPAYDSIICAMPIKIKDGTEAPIRLVSIISL